MSAGARSLVDQIVRTRAELSEALADPDLSADRTRYKIFDQILTLETQGLALRRGDSDFRLAVDTALSEMYRNGSMEKAFSKALPGVQPGGALAAMFLLAPINP